ncbi:MAG: 3'-5' exonuclease [Candidatus Pacebacteria bacterium]|jgi:DNA polymerase III alpha subunit (gram-positive type)|nr:3'-5' exonuclease [Candidatus Paceibacterota bacterium]
MNDVCILDRPIAITDVETTGHSPITNEIIDIGLVLIDQRTFDIIDTMDTRVKPEHPETASAKCITHTGYNEADWVDAPPLSIAMSQYAKKTQGALFAAHNMAYDWSFIAEAFRRTAVTDNMDYHRLELFTIGWTKLRTSGIDKLNKDEVAKWLGLPVESMPHKGFNGAMSSYRILKRLMQM